MKIFKNKDQLRREIGNKKTISFVPTMGCLHKGHISLIKIAKKYTNETLVSIYVNPTQFNDKEDLKKYPRNIKEDLKKVNRFENVLVYTPENNDLYHNNESSKQYDFGSFTNLMEGKHRPGHFDGVATIIEKLFKIFNPDNAYFGEKDFQQLLLIKTLTEQLDIKTNVVGCKTIREADGLAMSSRNKLMSDKERKSAKEIIKLLLWAKEVYSKFDFIQIKDEIENRSKLIDSFELEYFEIMNLEEFSSISKKNNETRAFMACRIGNIRLIDNIKL